MENKKEDAINFINNGGKAVYRYGWSFKGAGAKPITKEDALNKLSKKGWDFGKGFYTLSWIKGEQEENILEFNELSENDMW